MRWRPPPGLPNDWPDLLPEIVLGAVRTSSAINDDPLTDLFRILNDPPPED